MGLVSEFRTFIQRGNAVDMAVGVIVGTAFGKVVSSVVNDLLMPPLGLLVGRVSFSHLRVDLGGPPEAPVALHYGAFLQAVFDFLIIAFCIFLLVRAVNALKQPEPAPAPVEPSVEERLLTEIRDLLRERW
jgi:large conductance mechanosensitive channel